MKRYAAQLKNHLGRYATQRLGVTERGIFKGRRYEHILPPRLRLLNFLESVRAELRQFLEEHPEITLHRYFHHLNSSQAFAFNFFYPYFAAESESRRALSRAFGIDSGIKNWAFELVPNEKEGTNVDVAWTTPNNEKIFCEVKLSENEFGQAKDDAKHRRKLETIYAPRLENLVSKKLLSAPTFFKHYQLLRNVSLLAESPNSRLIFLYPRENETLRAPLNRVLDGVGKSTRQRIHIAHVEDCIESLTSAADLAPALLAHAAGLYEKYVI